MENWHSTQLDNLSKLIQEEFFGLYKKYNKGDVIYGVVLVLDDDGLTSYMAISTKKSNEKMHKGIEWEGYSWVQGFFDDNDDVGVRSFTPVMMDHYYEDIQPLLSKGYDFDEERRRNINLYISATKKAKQQSCNSVGSDVNSMVFYITIPGEPEIDRDSAIEINEPSDNLNWFLESYKKFL